MMPCSQESISLHALQHWPESDNMNHWLTNEASTLPLPISPTYGKACNRVQNKSGSCTVCVTRTTSFARNCSSEKTAVVSTQGTDCLMGQARPASSQPTAHASQHPCVGWLAPLYPVTTCCDEYSTGVAALPITTWSCILDAQASSARQFRADNLADVVEQPPPMHHHSTLQVANRQAPGRTALGCHRTHNCHCHAEMHLSSTRAQGRARLWGWHRHRLKLTKHT
jgi:hypothetical protein